MDAVRVGVMVDVAEGVNVGVRDGVKVSVGVGVKITSRHTGPESFWPNGSRVCSYSS